MSLEITCYAGFFRAIFYNIVYCGLKESIDLTSDEHRIIYNWRVSQRSPSYFNFQSRQHKGKLLTKACVSYLQGHEFCTDYAIEAMSEGPGLAWPDQTKALVIIALYVSLLTIGMALVMLRIYVRARIVRAVWIGDYTIVFALLSDGCSTYRIQRERVLTVT